MEAIETIEYKKLNKTAFFFDLVKPDNITEKSFIFVIATIIKNDIAFISEPYQIGVIPIIKTDGPVVVYETI